MTGAGTTLRDSTAEAKTGGDTTGGGGAGATLGTTGEGGGSMAIGSFAGEASRAGSLPREGEDTEGAGFAAGEGAGAGAGGVEFTVGRDGAEEAVEGRE